MVHVCIRAPRNISSAQLKKGFLCQNSSPLEKMPPLKVPFSEIAAKNKIISLLSEIWVLFFPPHLPAYFPFIHIFPLLFSNYIHLALSAPIMFRVNLLLDSTNNP